jgi:hypothetical protein
MNEEVILLAWSMSIARRSVAAWAAIQACEEARLATKLKGDKTR